MARIAIIGGGIGGLTTAIALRRHGFEPQVFEQAPKLLDVGAAIALWSNAIRVIEYLGLAEKVIQNGGTINGIQWWTTDGSLLKSVRLRHDGLPSVALHRADLQRILLEALPSSSVNLGHTFREVRQDADSISIYFEQDKSVESELLIGADGIHSRVRREMADDRDVVFRGYTVWRGISPSTPASLPPNTAIEIHGRGRRFGIGPVGHGRVGWWAAANLKPGEHEPRSVAIEHTTDDQEELLRLFEGWCAPVNELIQSTPEASVLRTQATDRPPSKSWGLRRVTLLGDAVHPTTPNLGQGGCMAIEDAVVLARCFEKYAVGEQTLRAYERVRYSRTAMLTQYSRLYGRIGQWEQRSACALRSAALSAVPQLAIASLMKVIFDYDATAVRL